MSEQSESHSSSNSHNSFETMWFAILSFLRSVNAPVAFGLPDDDMGILVAAAKETETSPRIVLCRDQRNAAYMAIGNAQATGGLGVCVVGKGPAAINVTTALLEADAGRIPLLVIATGTATDRLGTSAFQEADQIATLATLTKYAVRVGHSSRLQDTLDRAALIATSDRPGPVYVELPTDLVSKPAPMNRSWRALRNQRMSPDRQAFKLSLETLRTSHYPLILIGGGAKGHDMSILVQRFAKMLGAGIFVTASGRSHVSEESPYFLGVAGLYANECTADLWSSTDLVVALGTRLEETATFGWPATSPRVLQVNITSADIAVQFEGEHLIADSAEVLRLWSRHDLTSTAGASSRRKWVQRIEKSRERALEIADNRLKNIRSDEQRDVHLVELLDILKSILPRDVILVQENGLQDMWSYFFPYWTFASPGVSIVPSEQAPLGFGAAAAVGAATSSSSRPVVAIVGDGAFNLFRSELPTLLSNNIFILYIVLDNGGYGWLEHNMREHLGNTSPFSFTDTGTTGNGALAEACGIFYSSAQDRSQLSSALTAAWQAYISGRLAICEISVRLDDTPPGLDTLAGDFPAAT